MLTPDEAGRWLREPVIAEEKLDGANVSLWLDPSAGPKVASRGGPDAMDRAGQLGRLRAWVGERLDAVGQLLADGWALYGEWLWLRHGTAYDALPDWLVVLDLWHVEQGFAAVSDRDDRAGAVGMTTPPHVYAGVLGDARRLQELLERSAYATNHPMEGLVLRAGDGRRCKVIDPNYQRRTDEQWKSRSHNQLIDQKAAAEPNS